MKFKYFSYGSFLLLTFLATGCSDSYNPLQNREMMMAKDLIGIEAETTAPTHALTYSDVLEIALRQNLDLMVQAQQIAVEDELVTGAHLKLLPRLMVDGAYNSRNNTLGSASKSLIPNIPPAPPSTSTDRDIFEYDMIVSWNLLDFGLSYIRATQELHKRLKTFIEYERMRQKIILETTQRYWKAVSAKRGLDFSKVIYDRLAAQQEVYRRLAEKQVLSQKQALDSEANLINFKVTLQNYEYDFEQAKTELLGYLGLMPDTEIVLLDPGEASLSKDIGSLDELEVLALTNRPELFTQDIDERITLDDARFALLQILPLIEPSAGSYFNSNSFLTNKHWLSAGFRASWNLLSIPQHLSERRAAWRQKDLVVRTRMGISMAILTQVNLGYRFYQDALDKYQLAVELHHIKQKIFETAQFEKNAGNLNEADLIPYEAEMRIAEANRLKQYAAVRVALEQMNNAVGVEFYFSPEVL